MALARLSTDGYSEKWHGCGLTSYIYCYRSVYFPVYLRIKYACRVRAERVIATVRLGYSILYPVHPLWMTKFHKVVLSRVPTRHLSGGSL